MQRPREIVSADTYQSYAVAGGNYTIIIDGTQTGGKYAVIDMLVPPGCGPGPHAHAGIQESFLVLEGSVVFKSETQTITGSKGASVLIPEGGAIHCFKNESDTMARLLCTVTPAGLESFFREIGEPVAAHTFLPAVPPDPETMGRIQEAGKAYGQEFFPPGYLDRK